MKTKIDLLKNQAGWTLVELMTVVVILGLLGGFSVTRFTSAFTEATIATSMLENAHTLDEMATTFTSRYGLSSETSDSNPIIKSGSSLLDVLIEGGDDHLESAYVDLYKNSGLKKLSNIAVKDGTGWKISGYPVDFTNTATVYSDVPTAIVEQCWEAKTTATFDASTAVTSGSVQFTAASAGGTHTLTIPRD